MGPSANNMVSSDEKQALLPRTSSDDAGKKSRYVLVIHGGAGTMSKEGASPEQRARYKAALSRALEAGYAVLKDGGEAMDAAVAAVSSMEGEHTVIDARGLRAHLHLPRLPALQLREGRCVQRGGQGVSTARSHTPLRPALTLRTPQE